MGIRSVAICTLVRWLQFGGKWQKIVGGANKEEKDEAMALELHISRLLM